jgi:thiamine biosynthesis lipoprotein
MKKRVVFIAVTTVMIAGIMGLYAFPRQAEYTDFAMGSVLTHTYWGSGAKKTADNTVWAMEFAEDFFTKGEFPQESVYTQTAKEIYEASGGAFNPWLGALTRLWNIDGKDGGPPYVPAQDEIDEALVKTEWDFGAIGKGAACDQALLFLPSRRLSAAVINLGGNIMTYGQKPWRQPFKIALRDPRGGPNDSIGRFTLRGTHFISTSGSYEKYFVRDGVKYHHIFDPETGSPACRDPELISVTVITGEGEYPGGALGDALSTACFVLGYEESLALLEKFGCDALFVYEDGEVRAAGRVMEYYEAW